MQKLQYIDTIHIREYKGKLYARIEVYKFIQQLIMLANEDDNAHIVIQPKVKPTEHHTHETIVNTYIPRSLE